MLQCGGCATPASSTLNHRLTLPQMCCTTSCSRRHSVASGVVVLVATRMCSLQVGAARLLGLRSSLPGGRTSRRRQHGCRYFHSPYIKQFLLSTTPAQHPPCHYDHAIHALHFPRASPRHYSDCSTCVATRLALALSNFVRRRSTFYATVSRRPECATGHSPNWHAVQGPVRHMRAARTATPVAPQAAAGDARATHVTALIVGPHLPLPSIPPDVSVLAPTAL